MRRPTISRAGSTTRIPGATASAFSTSVVVSAREEADVGKLAVSDKWEETEADERQRVWTDDYSNVLGAVYRRLRYGEQ